MDPCERNRPVGHSTRCRTTSRACHSATGVGASQSRTPSTTALNPDSKAPKDAKVLSKPFHLRELVNEVEKLLAA